MRRGRPIAEERRRAGEPRGRPGPRGLALAALIACLGLPAAALAQSPVFTAQSPVAGQPDNPGTGQVPGADGLPALRTSRSPRADLFGNGLGGAPTAGDNPAGPETGPSLSNIGTARRAARLGDGPNNRPNSRAPASLLRQRAAPPRRIGSATQRITRAVTQVPPPALRLSPVVQSPVVGVPLPAPFPVAPPTLGLQTPGALLGAALRRPLAVPEDAYAPLGIKLGTVTFFPAFTQGLGYDSNPDQITDRAARGSVALRSEGELNFRSDWSSSELAGELRGGYFSFPENDAASRPNGQGNVRLRLDANRDLRVDVEGRFLVDTQRTGSPDLQAASAASRPIIATYGTSVGATQTFNRLQVSLRGLIDRSEFEDARLSDGTVLSQADRNLNQYGLRLRTAYEISPVITPFVDLLADTRVYDLRRDASGLRRDSDGVAVTAGAAFALNRFLTGEIAAGLQHRTYVDPALRDINAPIVNAALVWAASPLTTFRFGAVTGVTETTVPGSSGILTEAATLEVQHDLLRNLSLTLGGALLRNDYQNTTIRETGFSVTSRLDYRFNRWLTFRGSYIYQQIDSTAANASFKDNTFLVGLRVNP
ncbi:outer membrane beta-barrel protein [Methylobacterium nigriterrae]|uniref:outer membrane beta-barrel protein n=1 Tax=Methylobacterium nigriterrae TaxID=3127512 RepID=UPI003013D0F4